MKPRKNQDALLPKSYKLDGGGLNSLADWVAHAYLGSRAEEQVTIGEG
jgi:hypothetical protein